MVEPLTAIGVGLSIHLGKKVLDRFWDRLSSSGSAVAISGSSNAYAIDQGVAFYAPLGGLQTQYQWLVGDLYLPQSIALSETDIPVVLAVDETTGEAIVFSDQFDEWQFEIALPPGLYSMYAFVLDSYSESIEEATVVAVGLPSSFDIDGAEGFTYDGTEEGFWGMFDDRPVLIEQDGPYGIDFITLDPIEFHLPNTFGGLFLVDEGSHDLSGTWIIYEEYEFGVVHSTAYLMQRGDAISGYIDMRDQTDEGDHYFLRQAVVGGTDGVEVALRGIDISVLQGWYGEYFLDSWAGQIESADRIVGLSEDAAGTTGTFIMERVAA